MAKEFYNVEYEKCLLGIMLNDNSIIDLVTGKINSDQFYHPTNGRIFDAICDVFVEKKCATILNVSAKFDTKIAAYIATLTDNVNTTSNWEFYLNEVKNFWLARKLKSDLGDKVQSLNVDTVIDTIHDLDSSLTDYMKYDNGHASTMRELCQDLTKTIIANFQKPDEYLGYETEWRNLNDIIDGLQTGKLVIIGARPSVGKTAFAIQMAAGLASKGIPVDFFSLEMRAQVLLTRMVSQETCIPIPQIIHGTITQSEMGMMKLNNAMSKIFEYPLRIYDQKLKSEKELYSRIRVDAKTKGTKIFFVDHIGLIRHSDPMMKRVEQLDQITDELAALSKELDITIICLSQLRRDAEGKEPTLSDLRDSGAIEQNADICMFLHRNRATGSEISIPSKVIVIKHRDGACGTANMLFLPRSTKFVVDENIAGKED